MDKHFFPTKWSVSIHAPAWGATASGRYTVAAPRSFNPRSRVGSDDLFDILGARIVPVSIHAPAWGATIEQRLWRRYARGFNPRSRVGSDSERVRLAFIVVSFNPRSRVGSDPFAVRGAGADTLFQSTLPRGERRWWHAGHDSMRGFNPRSRVGSDTVMPVVVISFE